MRVVKENFWKYVYLSTLSVMAAAGSMGVAYMINTVINGFFFNQSRITDKYFYFFGTSVIVFFVSRWVVSFGIIGFTQNILRRTRLDILQMILRSSYYSLIKNKERIYTAMTRDAANIVQASVSIVDIVTNGIIGVICFIYMGILSWKLLLSLFALLFFTVILYIYSMKKQRNLYGKAMSHDDRFIKYLGEILEGFKEIVIDRKIGLGIERKQIVHSIDGSVEFTRKALVSNLNNRVIGQMAFYVFIGMILLFLGRELGVNNKTLINFVFLVLYVYGPIETVVVLIPALSQANASFNKLGLLKKDLRATEFESIDASEAVTFRTLTAKDLRYEYRDENNRESLFSIGPVDLSFSSGEIVFIFGGNGSGKTTLINLLIGLFPCEMGNIYINDKRVENTSAYSYRLLYAPVFSDFHLFDECYGIAHMDEQKAREYIKLFELEGKVDIDGNKFTTINLSTGQRKRLALICAMLENKQILVLDEFAADQDPYFRRKFYLEILEFMKNEGFTVIAVTHDDNYYDYCDTIYKMDAGLLELIKKNDINKVREPSCPII